MTKRRWQGGIAIAGLSLMVGLLGACSDSGGGAPLPGMAATGAASADSARQPPPAANGGSTGLFGPGTVTLMWCNGTAGGPTSAGAALASYSRTTGRATGERSISFTPQGGKPDYLCSPSTIRRSQQQVRQLFDRDYTMVAGTAPAGTRGKRAIAFDLASGRAVGPASQPDTFDAAPQDGSPVFAPDNSLWYQTRDRRILARDSRAAPASAVERGRSTGNGFLLAPDSTPWSPLVWEMGSTGVESINPTGTVAAVYNTTYGLRLVRNGQEETDGPRIGERRYAEKALPGAETIPDGCAPRFWPGPNTLVCADRRSLYRVTFADGFASVTNVESLLPPGNERNITEANLAPDAKSILFIAEATSVDSALYDLRLDTPGATPTKITVLPHPANSTGALPTLIAVR
ncbi:hypothetical protein ACFRCG_12785 [Embleya sp. NPDC056575]|uniref:hypothetical protein n=1 Tax=unclassified Embleya TaxID=2699296 RepID=UPI0036A816C9